MENEKNIKPGHLVMMIIALTVSAFAYVIEDKVRRKLHFKKQ